MSQPRVLFTTTGLRISRSSRRSSRRIHRRSRSRSRRRRRSSRRHLKLNEIKLIYSLYYIST
jgi:hypothetical protein